ncbi:WxL domain-containing protein [Enterococcus ratti]|nr:WxL domain-containing protein [Enterococcus ratti]
MKKINLVGVVCLGAIIIGGVMQNQMVHADSKSTQARVVVNPGQLSIKSADNLVFADIQIDGTDHVVHEPEGTNAKVTVEDFRGTTSKGWTLKAKLSEGNFNGLGLKLTPALNTNTEVATVATNTSNLNNQDQLIASIDNDRIANSDFETEILLNATLNIPKNTKVNTYTTTIIWNLAEGPETADE